jgi:hypothetical protein
MERSTNRLAKVGVHRFRARPVVAQAANVAAVAIAAKLARIGHDCQWESIMPRSRLGPMPMTAAQRQARHGAKHRSLLAHPVAPTPRLPPRPQRWAAAVADLLALQDE